MARRRRHMALAVLRRESGRLVLPPPNACHSRIQERPAGEMAKTTLDGPLRGATMPSEPKKDWLRRIAWSVVGLGLLLALAGLGRYLYEYYGENRMNLIRGLDKLQQGMSEEEVEQV